MFKKLPKGHKKAQKAWGHKAAASFSREQLMTLQYTKLLNYHVDDMAPEWSGEYSQAAPVPVSEGLKQFLKDTEGTETWVHKQYENLPWGPDNVKLMAQSSDALGAPYEAYLSLGNAMVTMNQASRMLAVDAATLIAVKLLVLIDKRVVSEAVKRMLKPRSLWPKVKAKTGVKGQSLRLNHSN